MRDRFLLSATTIALLAGASAVSACTEREVVLRSRSPGGTVDALNVLAMGGGAAGWVDYEIYIVRSGEEPTRDGLVLVAGKFTELSLVWKQPKLLHVVYEKAAIAWFKNYRSLKAEQDGYYVVEIRLEPLGTPFSLPQSYRDVLSQ